MKREDSTVPNSTSSPILAGASDTLWTCGVKRIIDILAALVLLILVSPVCILAAILVKLTSPGPLFFVQDRSGWNGQVFRLPKFRTMRGGRKPDVKELVPLDHPEITPMGRLLRRLKIDELPQLICILSGKMSLIGPRPTLPNQVAAYDEFRRQRLLLRPGLTGLAQVYSSASASWEERILYDIAYVRRCRLTLDVTILLRTIWVVLVGEKAQDFCVTRYARFVTPPDGYEPSAVSNDKADI